MLDNLALHCINGTVLHTNVPFDRVSSGQLADGYGEALAGKRSAILADQRNIK